MNLKNISSVLILVLIILGIIYLWNVQQEQNQAPEDPVLAMLEDLQASAEIDSEITTHEFTWNVGGEKDIQVQGWQFQEIGMLDGTSHLYAFLESEGFSSDPYNVAAGTIGSITGMRHESTLCLVEESVQVDNSGMPVPSGATDIVISCGKTQESLDIDEIVSDVIAQAFAQKYEVDVSGIEIDMQKRSDDHVRGLVTILDDNAIAGEDDIAPGDSGIFLAVKEEDEWIIVFDGNGSYACEDIEEYDFPDDMIEDCSAEEE